MKVKDQDIKKLIKAKIKLLREAGLKWSEVKNEIEEAFPHSPYNFDVIRVEFQNEYKFDENRIDKDKVYLNVARSRNQLALEKKILTKQRNSLNNELNVQAFRQMVLDELATRGFQRNIHLKDRMLTPGTWYKVVYIISDEHYKGKQDNNHLKAIYQSIKDDIKMFLPKDYTVELWFLGDGIDGLIHTGSLAQNDGAIGPMLDYCNITIDCINQIPQVKDVKYVCKSNHTQTRPLGTKRNDLAREDLGFVICEMFRHRLRKDIYFQSDDIIKFFDPEWEINVALLHGHQPYAKSKDKMIEYWSSKYSFIPDLIYMGHYHNFKVSEFGVNKFLCVAPTAKRFCGDYETENGYISTSQIVRLSYDEEQLNWKIINIPESKK